MSILVRWATRWDRTPLTEMIGELARQHGVLASRDTISAAFDYALNHADRIRIAVAQDDDKQVLGTASLHEAYSTWNASPYGTIEDFFVLPEHRGTGIGTEIMNLLYEEARRRGYCRVELQVQEDNDRRGSSTSARAEFHRVHRLRPGSEGRGGDGGVVSPDQEDGPKRKTTPGTRPGVFFVCRACARSRR